MAEQAKVRRRTADRAAPESDAPSRARHKSGDEIRADIDDLLDSIDEALGENAEFAEEFVRSFVQKGGE